MNWVLFAVAALVGLVIDQGLLDVIALDAFVEGSARQIKPNVCAILAVFIAISAPRTAALWGCFLLGLLVDLSTPLMLGDGGRVFHLVGPYALGYAGGGWIVLRARAALFRQRAVTLGVTTLVFVLALNAVVLAVYLLRAVHSGPALDWSDGTLPGEVGRRLLVAVYSGLAAIPVGWLLVRTLPAWGFEPATERTPPALR